MLFAAAGAAMSFAGPLESPCPLVAGRGPHGTVHGRLHTMNGIPARSTA